MSKVQCLSKETEPGIVGHMGIMALRLERKYRFSRGGSQARKWTVISAVLSEGSSGDRS